MKLSELESNVLSGFKEAVIRKAHATENVDRADRKYGDVPMITMCTMYEASGEVRAFRHFLRLLGMSPEEIEEAEYSATMEV